MELVENHLSDLPSVNGSPFTLVVTLGIDALMSGIGVAIIDTGHRISAGEARRLACKAGIIPMVLDGKSMPLDRGSRAAAVRPLPEDGDPPPLQARLRRRRHCDRPTGVDASTHHQDPWHLGGPTDAKKGISFCAPHHHMADHPQTYDMKRLPNGKIRFTRRQ